MSLCDNLKLFRKQAKLTRKDVAKHLNLSDRTIGHYETGYTKPTIDDLELMAKLYNKTLPELIGNEHDKVDESKILNNVIEELIEDGSLTNKNYSDLNNTDKELIISALNKFIKSKKGKI